MSLFTDNCTAGGVLAAIYRGTSIAAMPRDAGRLHGPGYCATNCTEVPTSNVLSCVVTTCPKDLFVDSFIIKVCRSVLDCQLDNATKLLLLTVYPCNSHACLRAPRVGASCTLPLITGTGASCTVPSNPPSWYAYISFCLLGECATLFQPVVS